MDAFLSNPVSQNLSRNNVSRIVNVPFVCEKCRCMYATLKALQRHQLSDCNGLIFNCNACGRQFNKESSFKAHCSKSCQSLSGVSTIAPEVVSRQFDTTTTNILNNAPAMNVNLMNYPFPAKRKLQKENIAKSVIALPSHLLPVQLTTNPCPIPPAVLSQLPVINDTGNVLHASNDIVLPDKKVGLKKFPCTLCNNKYATRAALVRHQLNHLPEKPFKCPRCPKQFSHPSSFRNHYIRTCPYSNLRSAVRRSQTPKIDVNTGLQNASYRVEPIITTGVCVMPNKIIQTSLIQSHPIQPQKVNCIPDKKARLSAVRPWVCGICGCSYAFRAGLQRHQLTHLPDRPYKCPNCGSGFSHPSVFKSHKMRCLSSTQREVTSTPNLDSVSCNLMEMKTEPEVKTMFISSAPPMMNSSEIQSLSERQHDEQPQQAMSLGDMESSTNQIQIVKTDPQDSSPPADFFPVNFDSEVVNSSFCNQSVTLDISHQQIKVMNENDNIDCSVLKPFASQSVTVTSTPNRNTNFSGSDAFDQQQNHASFSGILKSSLRQWMCTECGRSYATKAGLLRHQLTHRSEKPFRCSRCGAQFSHPSSYRNHCIRTCGHLPERMSISTVMPSGIITSSA